MRVIHNSYLLPTSQRLGLTADAKALPAWEVSRELRRVGAQYYAEGKNHPWPSSPTPALHPLPPIPHPHGSGHAGALRSPPGLPWAVRA